MREFAKGFYQSKEWKKVSRLYMSSRNYVCERCGEVATICHHKTYLTPQNITDPNISLSFDNLECLCQDCHNKEHFRQRYSPTGTAFDENGNLVRQPCAFIVCGAPGSGKTSFVRRHMGKRDIVWDMDYICMALLGAKTPHGNHDRALTVAADMREAFYDCVVQHKGQWEKAWIITSVADMTLIDALARRLNADVILMASVTLEQCTEQINNDPDRPNKLFHIRLAEKWYEAMKDYLPPDSGDR